MKKLHERRAQRGRNGLLVLGAGVLTISALTAAAIMAAGPQLDQHPEESAHAKEVYHFEDLGSLVNASHLVVYGTVTAAEPGRLIGTDDEVAGSEIRLRKVTVEVWDVLHNPKKIQVPSAIYLEEEGWDANGRGYMINDVTWSEPGQIGYYFLRKSTGSDAYHLINSQGRALLVNGVLTPSSLDSDLGESIATMPSSTLVTAVQQASTSKLRSTS